MAKKIFTRARLVKGIRWHIDFTIFDATTGNQSRSRRDFDLNEIEDLAIREAVAIRIVANIEAFVAPKQKSAPATAAHIAPCSDATRFFSQAETVAAAMRIALSEKLKSPRKNTHRGYKSISKKFLSWAESESLAALTLTDFSRRHARAFFDWLQASRKYRGCTINNYLTHLKALWSEMQERELVKENPWKFIKAAKKEEKLRRCFSDEERVAIAREIEKTDYWLFRGVLLQFYCYVRPVELTRLKFKDFDFSSGTVTVQEGDAKSWKKVVKTLPRSILHYFLDGRFERYPLNFYVFGRKAHGKQYRMEPCAVQIDDDRMYKRHKKVLNRLKTGGKLSDLSGLTWYSWKDTGISIHTRRTSPVATKDQAGHSDLSITSLYYHAAEVNEEYRNLENDLFSKE